MLDGLAMALEAAGLQVEEVPDWRWRGKTNFSPIGVMLHDTVGGTDGDAPSLNIVTYGRSDLPGPLYNVLVGRSGRVYVVASGRANHAGRGTGAVEELGTGSGNRLSVGVGLENSGPGHRYPTTQLTAVRDAVIAINTMLGVPLTNVWGHKEYSPGRKIDPHSIDMDQFRSTLTNQEPAMNFNPSDHAEVMQAMLVSLGFDLGQTGPNGDGVDGDWGPKSQSAWVRIEESVDYWVAVRKVVRMTLG